MSNTPVQEPPTQGLSSGSGQTLPSRPLQPSSDPSASKRVCFYKSGDYQFGGHRMVINARTFKTFDALLDALSKKVPLPFGVRTITTPRGTHLVRTLDDLLDGGAYVCSDQKRVKPLNLHEVNRRQVPWNTTRPLNVGRRRRQALRFGQSGSRNETTSRPAKVTERVAVRTPKKLMVIKNRDPTVKRTIVLQRRTAPTFDALLDYLSQILQFPVLKLYSTDGRRVDGLSALILCSGVVVAAGNEPFRLGNYSFHRTGQMAQAMYVETVEPSMLQPRTQKKKSFSSGRGSRNFSVSSERYIVNQISRSQNGHLHPHNGSSETEASQHHTSMETSGTGRADNMHQTCIVPHDDDIEKSFRVNQDGSMTVEMKVHLTIKEEEILHWSTTLSRSSLSKRTACASMSESGNRSPDSNNAIAKDSSNISEEEMKEENYPPGAGKGVDFNDERTCEGYTSTAMGKAKKSVKRTPTPGPRHVKKASIESVKRVTESGVQESTLGHYSYVERTADGETTEGYCVVRHSSSSNRPIPKPRKTASAGASKKCSSSSIRSSGVAEVLQIENNGMEFTETVMHIYETQGSYDNYFANQEYSVDGIPLHGSPSAPESKQSTESGPHSSSNDCDIDCSWQPPTADSLQRQKEEMLSLSSEPVSLTHDNTNNLSSPSENETQRNLQIQERVKLDDTSKSTKKKKMTGPARSQKSPASTSSTDKKPKENLISPPENSKHSSTDKLSSQTSVGKRSLNSSESAKRGQKSKGTEKKAESPHSKNSSKGEKTPKKNSASLVRTEDLKRTQRQNTNKAAASDNGHNVNTPTGRPQMKKNMSDILQPNKALLLGKKKSSKPKSMSDSGISQTKTSISMPSLDPSPSEIHQYVENWLEKVSPDQVLYPEEAITEGTQPQTKVIFQIGGDSESDEKNECQTNLDEDYPSPDDVIKKSASCLSVPFSHEELAAAQVLSVSMPNVRAELVHQENRLRLHKSAEAIGPDDDDASSSNFLSPKVKIKPALQQLCSSIQCIRRASDVNVTSNLEKSSSLPDFPTHVASVFGSSCKAFLSFLSVMTLRDYLTGNTPGEGNKSSTTSEAMLMMESLQKISAIEDEEEQRASLTDLQSRSSSHFRQNWKDFQILRERLESEPLSPKVSETEFALDVVSEGGDAFEEHNLGIDELMDELSMPQDLREEITSTIKTFYPVEESQCVETDRNQSESEEDVEQFVRESNNEMKQPDSDSRCVTEDTSEDTSEIKHSHDDAVYTQQGKIMNESDQPGEAEKSQTEKEESLKDKENETKEDESRQEGKLKEVEEVKIQEYGHTKETEADSEGTQKGDRESEEEVEEEPEQAKSGEVTDEESIDNQEADEEAETKEEDSRKEEQPEEEEEVKIREYGNAKETEAVSEGFEQEDQESEEEGEPEPEQSKSVEVSAVESIDNEEAGADEEEETKKEESRKEEQLEEVEEVKIREYGNTKETETVSESNEKDDREKEEAGEEEPAQSESEEMSGEESINTEKAGADEEEDETEEEEEEMTLDEKELGVELEEGEKEEADETEEAFMNEDSTQYSAEETDEREGAEETEEEEEVNEKVEGEGEKESSDEGENEQRQEEKEDVGENMEEINEGEEVENVTEEVEQEEEEEEEEEEENGELHFVLRDVAEEIEEGTEVSDNEKNEMGNITESDEVEEVEAETSAVTVTDAEEEVTEKADEDMEMEDVTEDINEQEAEEQEEPERIEEVSEGKQEEEEEVEEEREQEREFEEEGGGESEVKNTAEESTRTITDEEEVDEGRETDVEDEKYDEAEDSRRELEQIESTQEEESAEERECVVELEMNENLTAGQIGDEEEREDDEEKESQEKSDQEETQGTGSPSKYSSEGQCADDKGNGTDTVTETDEGGEMINERNGNLSHPVEISQELLDFVNYALRSSSLIFIYDSEGNIRIEPDNAQVVQIKQTIIPKSRKDSSYGLKRLPSPSTSDLSDYRPGTSESGGYKTQDSFDIMSESGEEASERPSQVYTHSADRTERTNVELINSKLSVASNSEIFHGSSVSGTKASMEDLSSFRSTSLLKAGAAASAQAAQCISFVSENSADGVLIDQGRWLLKENHLIRKSPPVSLGMYSNLDSTSLDTGQENTSDDSPPHFKTQHSPLAALSSSELEELAKPPTPKCIYYNMPHGSDSDPFLDDCSVRSSARGRGVRVSPTIDTSKTWANKNGSQSSFASVEFRIPDRKVHPEEEPTVVTQPRRTSGGEDHVLQSQNSVDNLRLRCGQYCPIL